MQNPTAKITKHSSITLQMSNHDSILQRHATTSTEISSPICGAINDKGQDSSLPCVLATTKDQDSSLPFLCAKTGHNSGPQPTIRYWTNRGHQTTTKPKSRITQNVLTLDSSTFTGHSPREPLLCTQRRFQFENSQIQNMLTCSFLQLHTGPLFTETILPQGSRMAVQELIVLKTLTTLGQSNFHTAKSRT